MQRELDAKQVKKDNLGAGSKSAEKKRKEVETVEEMGDFVIPDKLRVQVGVRPCALVRVDVLMWCASVCPC